MRTLPRPDRPELAYHTGCRHMRRHQICREARLHSSQISGAIWNREASGPRSARFVGVIIIGIGGGTPTTRAGVPAAKGWMTFICACGMGEPRGRGG